MNKIITCLPALLAPVWQRAGSALLGSLLLALRAAPALGQTEPAPPSSWQTIFFESPATALPLLSDAAIKHSARLKAIQIEKSISEQDLRLAKQNILSSLALGGGYGYGNLAGGGASDPSTSSLFRTSPSIRYSTGISFTLSLDRAVSRPVLIKKQELIYQRVDMEQQDQQNQIQQQIIQLYQNVLLTRKLLTLQQEAYVSVQTNYQLAEKQFRLGQLTLPEFSAASASLSGAAISQAQARSQFDTAFMLLEEIAGARISTLMTLR